MLLEPREFSTRTKTEFLRKKLTLRTAPWSDKREARRGKQSWVEIYVDGKWKPQFWGKKIHD